MFTFPLISLETNTVPVNLLRSLWVDDKGVFHMYSLLTSYLPSKYDSIKFQTTSVMTYFNKWWQQYALEFVTATEYTLTRSLGNLSCKWLDPAAWELDDI